MIRKIIQSLQILIIVILFFSFCQNVPRQAGAEMVFDTEVYDFGRIEQGTVVTHVFNFENIGADTLQIKRVAST